MKREELGEALRGLSMQEIERIVREDSERERREEQEALDAFIDDPAGTMRYDEENHIIYVRTIEQEFGETYHDWDIYIRDDHGISVDDGLIDKSWPILGNISKPIG